MFLNKLWNITRFVHSGIWEIGKSYDELRKFIEKNYSEFSMHEKWICQKLAQITEKMTEWMEKFNFSMTGEDLMAFTRDDFADFFIEEYKLTKADSKYAADILAYSVMTILKLWHPYAPFVTEELYSKLRPEESLIDSAWPELKLEKDSKIEKDTWMIYDVIRSIRNIRWLKWIKPGLLVKVIFKATKSNQDLLEENQVILKWLCKIEEFKVVDKSKSISEDDYVYWVSNNIEIFLDPGDTIDQEAEKLRLKEQIDGKKDYIRKLDQKLMNAEFVRNAPEHVVRIEQEKRVQAQDQLEKLLEKYNKI